MKSPRTIEVDGYDKVTIERSGAYTVSLNVDDGEMELELVLYANESKALRKALRAVESLLRPPSPAERIRP